MKKNVFLFLILYFFFNAVSAQTKNDSINTYLKVNKWAVVKLTIAYMEDYKGWPKNDAKQGQELETYENLSKKYDSYSDNIDLDEVGRDLSKGWEITRDRIFQNYRKELVGSIVPDNFEKINFVPETLSKVGRSKAIARIKSEYNSFLTKPIEVEEKEEEITSSISNEGSIFVNSNRKEKINIMDIITYLTLGFLLLLVFHFKNKLNKAKEEDAKKTQKKESSKTYNNLVREGEFNGMREQISSLEKEISTLKNMDLDLEDKLSLNKETVEEVHTNGNIKDNETVFTNDLPATNNQQISTKLIYFPSPFENYRFANEALTEVENQLSLYVVEIDKSTNKGKISLIETADFSRALNSPNTFLEPVCNYENAYNSSVKEVRVIAKGDIALEGEDWVVKSKIKIKFI